MANKDDDLTNHEGDETFEFEDSDNEFSVPDTPYGDDDSNAFSESDDFLGSDDLDDSSDVIGGDEFSIGDETLDGDDDADYQEVRDEEHESQSEHYDDHDPGPTGLGWKTYAGIAAAMVLTAGGMMVFLFPGDASQGSSQAQSMDPAQLQQIAQQSNAQSEQVDRQAPQNQAPQNNQVQGQQAGQGPVEVQAFPGAGGSNTNGFNNGNGGGSGNGGGNQMSAAEPQSSPITDPSAQPREEDRSYAGVREQRNMAMLDQQIEEIGSNYFVRKDEFAVLGRVVERNENQLKGLTRNVSASAREIEDLKKRIAMLEQGDASGESSSEPKKEMKPDPEIKDIQVILAAYGYAPGPLDGLLGVRTKAAISRFQKAHGIDVSGEVDSATKSVLEGDPKSNPSPIKRVATAPKNDKSSRNQRAGENHNSEWFIRGVTGTRAIVFKKDGTSYAVEQGTEIPGMGQVIAFFPQEREVKTSKGVIKEQ
jgi:peptidoglycan hydrolase-like protein with peptidoglycan-binding domain